MPERSMYCAGPRESAVRHEKANVAVKPQPPRVGFDPVSSLFPPALLGATLMNGAGLELGHSFTGPPQRADCRQHRGTRPAQ